MQYGKPLLKLVTRQSCILRSSCSRSISIMYI